MTKLKHQCCIELIVFKLFNSCTLVFNAQFITHRYSRGNKRCAFAPKIFFFALTLSPGRSTAA